MDYMHTLCWGRGVMRISFLFMFPELFDWINTHSPDSLKKKKIVSNIMKADRTKDFNTLLFNIQNLYGQI